jgi:2-dehydro-3-deoxyglucarate aldolase/4-hydroxy-2-oxoheptanedioate aldolase
VRFADKFKNDTPAIGTLITIGAPEVAEMLSMCGYDWLFIDMEHGALSIGQVQHIVQVIRNGCSAIVRVPTNDEAWIKRALDTGCDGIIIPHVNTAEEARRAVAASKYPPLGARSAGVGRAHDYGMNFSDYVAIANEQIALIVQAEHIDAVNNLDDILAVEGIDAIFIGPYDLSGSMNRLGEVTSEPVQAAINTIKQTCTAHNMPFGIFVMQAEAARQEQCNFVAVGTDAIMMWQAAKDSLGMLRGK